MGKLGNRFCAFAFLLLVSFAGEGSAEQGCGDGYVPTTTPTGVQCMPIPGLYRSGAGPEPAESTVYDGYGAFAFDAKGLKVGVSDPDELIGSEWRAKRSAIKSCKSNGGNDCKVIAVFKSECAVSMIGAVDSSGGDVTVYIGKGATISEAKDDAQKRCEGSGSPMCEAAYADCVERWRQ